MRVKREDGAIKKGDENWGPEEGRATRTMGLIGDKIVEVKSGETVKTKVGAQPKELEDEDRNDFMGGWGGPRIRSPL